MKNFIQLHKDDTIVVALQTFNAGDVITIGDTKIIVKETIEFGHKIAIKPMAKGNKIIKYGLSIGSATKDILLGEHVHSHNLKTDYVLSKGK
ncbi:hypothetical protein BWZ22_10365 [Seonamhaeicola sp. S2-3]|uniref:UxaA family hydrolase n=1 Tax=Seonamhaeicola sp. S2-3 TaxID=1936081 RepID=UPI0009729A34|nr:UxaA family hydrolase [Seonamhaeicola sp. S2-3]APY11621.1 hypothetical protein BWZ22_10365 [Seonamhaeicola sp. S2-3]